MKQTILSLWQENGELSMIIQRRIMVKEMKLPIVKASLISEI